MKKSTLNRGAFAVCGGSIRLVVERVGGVAAVVIEYGEDRGVLVDLRLVEVGVLLGGRGGLLIAVFVGVEVHCVGVLPDLLGGFIGVLKQALQLFGELLDEMEALTQE